MNKILKGSIVLAVFAIVISIFQMSCTDDAIAKVMDYVLPIATPSVLGGVKPDGTTILVDATGKISSVGATTLPIATTTTLGGVKPDGTTVTIDGTGKLSSSGLRQSNKIIFAIGDNLSGNISELWYANYDGSNKTQIPLPNLPPSTSYRSASISPDGQSIFFYALDYLNPDKIAFYSMSLTGTNLKKIFETPSTSSVLSLEAY